MNYWSTPNHYCDVPSTAVSSSNEVMARAVLALQQPFANFPPLLRTVMIRPSNYTVTFYSAVNSAVQIHLRNCNHKRDKLIKIDPFTNVNIPSNPVYYSARILPYTKYKTSGRFDGSQVVAIHHRLLRRHQQKKT